MGLRVQGCYEVTYTEETCYQMAPVHQCVCSRAFCIPIDTFYLTGKVAYI